MKNKRYKEPPTMEQRVAEAILQQPAEITIGRRTYKYPRPTLGTLILTSEAIAKLPTIEINETENVLSETLKHARHFKGLATIITILLLGSKRMRHTANPLHNINTRIVMRRLQRDITNELSPREIKDLLISLLQQIQCADFFAVTTFLQGLNITKPTREVEKNSTTAYGR